MKLRKYSEEQLKESIKSSNSFRQALKKLNVAPFGGNYDVIKKAVAYFNIDTSHFSGKGWAKGRCLPRISTKDYLSNEKEISSHKLRLRLIKEGYLDEKCSNCNLSQWLSQPIPLELDHINGNNKDNSLQNLRLLCPNCHALTPTYRGKNKAPKF